MAAHVFPRRVTSTATTVTVTGEWTPPYTLPSAGQAVFIGTTTGNGISNNVSPYDSGLFSRSLYESYGCGCYVEDYSDGGAYVVAGSGGHNHPPNWGAEVFDFTTATWSYIPNANGMDNSRSTDLQTNDDLDASLETIDLPGVTPNTMPPASHLYFSHFALPTSQGGGPRGSVLRLGFFAAVGTAGITSSTRAFRFDLDTGLYSKLSVNKYSELGYGGAGNDAPAIYVEHSQTYWQIPNQIHANTYGTLPYLDSADWTWKSTPGVAPMQTVQNQSPLYDPVGKLIIVFSATDNVGRILDTTSNATIAASSGGGWKTMNKTGNVPGIMNRWAYYPPDGCFYHYDGRTTPNVLDKLTPPASGSRVTGQWAFSQVNIGGVTMPLAQNSFDQNRHYTRFFYVPILQCFAWVASGSTRVTLLKP